MMCIARTRLLCILMQSDQCFHRRLTKLVDTVNYTDEQRRPTLDNEDAQADQGRCCLNMAVESFSDITHQ